ncbi:shikimate kinase [Aeromicrobium sp. Leaf350]|uniref:shikimate kinase n=1 Tax=Aeromicrobium sp. Leaf350 TaxID=2876565 RepID=UPI001E5CE65F|nr:shikimate kinase [Aeromicrobium sp. Leaf350]
MRPAVVLIGAPGAGKTTVGIALARRLGLAFRDTDADVVASTGREIADIFVTDGEAAFRAIEETAVAAALADHDGVLALGGGAVLSAATRDLLAGHTIVHLEVGLAGAARRVGLNASRPLLVGNVRGRLKGLLDERRPIYTALAGWSVGTDDRTPDEVVDLVLRLVGDAHDQSIQETR